MLQAIQSLPVMWIIDLDYYTATELVVLRTAEIEVFYDVKSGGSEKNNGRRFGRQQDKDLSRGSSPWISGNMV